MSNLVYIDENICKGCNLCVVTCPKKILALDSSKVNAKGYNPSSITDMAACTACAMCAIICPDSAITVEKEATK
jgi:2-oxoglutarate ferredoxin oxidoreductase subunit delta